MQWAFLDEMKIAVTEGSSDMGLWKQCVYVIYQNDIIIYKEYTGDSVLTVLSWTYQSEVYQ